ncbi:hypothetical protein [Chryseobacterium sp. Leaf180]|uniref:hypothetical protein n=1 Tax=Chryseobacterium sp. Leaf180 TaxID=1736289 RepID=UPI00103CDF6B|nr:hypothetical protein [Chryseobacterium sp. Leaf180]
MKRSIKASLKVAAKTLTKEKRQHVMSTSRRKKFFHFANTIIPDKQRIPKILLLQNSSLPKKVISLIAKGYPVGVIVLSITGKTWANLIKRIESGLTRPFSLSRKRKMVITITAMTKII